MPVEVVVIDASALATLLFDEPSAERVETAADEVFLYAPSLLPYELASVACKKIERHPDREPGLLAALDLLTSMRIDLVAVPPEDLARLAAASGLSAYDAAYFWLARRLGASLLTLDRSLSAAAKRHGVPCLPV